ncbi:MAG: hypothetical protein KJO29_01950, partial [Bacteroidia bacterium]|nr:hypothetical protein [Bacteroidia bacterium]
MKNFFVVLIIFCCTLAAHTQPTWDTTPSNQDFECDDAQNNTDITDYLNTITATAAAGCGTAMVTHNYVDPGDFNCNDLIPIMITATDDCGSITETINVSIDDTTDPSWDTTAPDLTESCDGIGNISGITDFINDVLNQVTASVSDDCTNPTD